MAISAAPQVSVEVVEYRSQSVFVTGEVRAPNKYSLQGNSTLMDVLTLAGSITTNAGNWVQITHARQGVDALGPSASAEYDMRVNLRDIQTGKAQNIKMRDGDTIFVPKAERIFVVGQVRNTGPVTFEEGMTVFEAIAAAGGITEKGSNSRISIIRIEKGQRREIDAQSDRRVEAGRPGERANPAVCENCLPQPERRARGSGDCVARHARRDSRGAPRLAARDDRGLQWAARRQSLRICRRRGDALPERAGPARRMGDARIDRHSPPPRRRTRCRICARPQLRAPSAATSS